MQAYPSTSPARPVAPARRVEGRGGPVTPHGERSRWEENSGALPRDTNYDSRLAVQQQQAVSASVSNPAMWDRAGNRDSLPPLVGIGLTFKRDKESSGYVVKRVVPGGPAYLDGGVEPGDAFVQVDGVAVSGKSPEDLTRLVLGPAGSKVELVVNRLGATLRFSLQRAPIELDDDPHREHFQKLRARQESVGAEMLREGARATLKEKTKELNHQVNEEASRELAMLVQDGINLDAKQKDAVLERLSEKALQTRTPPKLSHKELLEIAGVKEARPAAQRPQAQLPTPVPQLSPPPSASQQPVRDVRDSRLDASAQLMQGRTARDASYALGAQGIGAPSSSYASASVSTSGYSPPDRIGAIPDRAAPTQYAQHRTGVAPSQEPSQHPSQLSRANLQQHARAAHSQHQQQVYIDRSAQPQHQHQVYGSAHAQQQQQQQQGYLERAQDPHLQMLSLQHQNQQQQQQPQARQNVDGNEQMLQRNLEIYQLVAENSKRGGNEYVGKSGRRKSEDSWKSVESDRDLAMRLQTEEVMQHSLSTEWSSQSIGGSSRCSYASQEGTTYEELDDVDDAALRKMLQDNATRTDVGFLGGSRPSSSSRQIAPLAHQTAGADRDHHDHISRHRSDVPSHASSKNVSAMYNNGPSANVVPLVRPKQGSRHDEVENDDELVEYHAAVQPTRLSSGQSRRISRRLWVMRHGMRIDEQDATWKAKSDRPYDPYITEEGRKQARMAAEVLYSQQRDEGPIQFIVTSPFLRCVQTAAEVASVLGITRIIIDNGLCEVMLPRNVASRPVYIPPNRLHLSDPKLANFTYEMSNEPAPDWPEQLSQARVRYNDAFTRLPRTLCGNMLLIAHGDTVAQFVALSRGIPDDSVYSVPPCSFASAHVTLDAGETSWSRVWMAEGILTLEDMVE